MSNYQFFASKKTLAEFDNGIISFDNGTLKNKKRKKNYISDIDERNALRICMENDLSHARLYTDAANIAYIEWFYTEKNADLILTYIDQHLKRSKQIKLWNVWLGEKETPQITKCSWRELSKEKIKEIWGKPYFNQPECLIVYRY